MAFKLNEKTLEPHNGDYIAFLKEIEKGNAKVSGLTVSVNSDMPGMVTVRRANESDQAPSSPGFIAKNKNAMPALLRLAGSVIALSEPSASISRRMPASPAAPSACRGAAVLGYTVTW